MSLVEANPSSADYFVSRVKDLEQAVGRIGAGLGVVALVGSAEVPFLNGWSYDPAYGPVAFFRDGAGLVRFEGVLVRGSASALPAFMVPGILAPDYPKSFRTFSVSVAGAVTASGTRAGLDGPGYRIT